MVQSSCSLMVDKSSYLCLCNIFMTVVTAISCLAFIFFPSVTRDYKSLLMVFTQSAPFAVVAVK